LWDIHYRILCPLLGSCGLHCKMQDFSVILTCSVLCSSAPRMLCLAPFWRTRSRASSAKSALSVTFSSRSKSLLPSSSLSPTPHCPPFCVFSPLLTIRAVAARGSNMMARENSASSCTRTELGSYSVSIAWQLSCGPVCRKPFVIPETIVKMCASSHIYGFIFRLPLTCASVLYAPFHLWWLTFWFCSV